MSKLTWYVVIGTIVTIALNFVFLLLLGQLIGLLSLPFAIFIPLVSAIVLLLCLTPFKLSMNEKLKVVVFSMLLSLVTVPLFKFLYVFAH